MSGQVTSLRRRRDDIESDDEADQIRSSQDSSSATDSIKRARTTHAESESPPPEQSRTRKFMENHRHDNNEESGDEIDGEDSGNFKPGAIVRVKLTNFITYENAEFFPGPHLNMVIGPNGTGKSSVVCAICLGLGWDPKNLGRAGEVGEFVKHGMKDASIEIELQRQVSESENSIVRVRITRDGNKRDWWLNGKRTNLKVVQSLMKEYRIQVDNLCQFLPQDKVSEFAALSPVELLLQTQRAAASEDMLEMHEKLKKLRKEEISLVQQRVKDEEQLVNHEARQQDLRAEVERLQERNEIIKQVQRLKNTVPFVEYKLAIKKHNEFKAKKLNAQRRYADLKEKVDPTLRSVTEKEKYCRRIDNVLRERKEALSSAERDADQIAKDINALNVEISNIGDQERSEKASESKRKADVTKLQRNIQELKSKADAAPIVFDSVAWNERIRVPEHKARAAKSEMEALREELVEATRNAHNIRDKTEEAKSKLAQFNTQEGQQMTKLERVSSATAAAWKWVQENRDKFEKDVYGPALITCSVKDSRFTNAVESLLRPNDFLAITAQTSEDLKLLSDKFQGSGKVSDITLRSTEGRGSRPQMSVQDLQLYGMDGFAIDYIEGPEPVISMLCNSCQLDTTIITLRDINDEQYNMITRDRRVGRFVAGTLGYTISRRLEFGDHAVSTTTRAIRPARYWTEQPVDVSARQEIEDQIERLKSEFIEIREQGKALKRRISDFEDQITTENEKAKELKKEKDQLQRAFNELKALPIKIKREEDSLEQKRQETDAFRHTLRQLANKHDLAITRKHKKVMEYKNQISEIRACHDRLVEANIRLIEAGSDVEGLTARNQHILEQLQREEQRKVDMETQAQAVKKRAREHQIKCQAVMADPDMAADWADIQVRADTVTVEVLQTEIQAEESKLEYIHANNPNAIEDFERRQQQVERLQAKIDEVDEKLARITRHVTKTRAKWEPRLDALISEISDAFSNNFEQIGCAGEVSVHKDEDFNNWAIQIKVKFREHETLQLLDAHRQSGGERSVSTIFYLMSLQALAQAPFRVVDEINQGMDPRNERMVHERMVDIACKEHTSQYFLITPKLLTGLKYHKRMKVLCIASGEHMPGDYKTLDLRNIVGIQRGIAAPRGIPASG